MGRGTGKRVLVVMELGSNWGHLLRMRPVVQALQQEGFGVTVAATDLAAAQKLWSSSDVELVRCPGVPDQHRLKLGPEIVCYAQILDRMVFGDETMLARTLDQWRVLLSQVRPDALLADFAPGASLVAHLHCLPLVRLNSGWEAPVFDECLPIFRRGSSWDRARVMRLEADIVRRLNRACLASGAHAFENLSGLYDVGRLLLATWPELDHFAPRRLDVEYIGPIYSSDYGRAVDWLEQNPSTHRKRIWLYLAPDSRNAVIVKALKLLPVDVIAVMPGLRADIAAQLRSSSWEIHGEPVRLDRLLTRTDLVVSNGGQGVLAACLTAGVPMLLMPLTVEQAHMADKLSRTSSAISQMPVGKSLQNRLAEQISRLLRDTAPKTDAGDFARKYKACTRNAQLTCIAEAVNQAMAELHLEAPHLIP